jgi:hypothetical protein
MSVKFFLSHLPLPPIYIAPATCLLNYSFLYFQSTIYLTFCTTLFKNHLVTTEFILPLPLHCSDIKSRHTVSSPRVNHQNLILHLEHQDEPCVALYASTSGRSRYHRLKPRRQRSHQGRPGTARMPLGMRVLVSRLRWRK